MDLAIQRGEIFGFVGSNGCGKTTTMKMLTGLLQASGGEARLLGRPVRAEDLGIRRRVGYVSQAFSLYGALRVRRNVLLGLILFAFTVSVFAGKRVSPETLLHSSIAMVDDNRSQLSARLRDAFRPPFFQAPRLESPEELERRLDAGLDSFALSIPSSFERDLLTARRPALQMHVDATRMGQALSGSGDVQRIVFNPELSRVWFSSNMKVINQVTLLSLLLSLLLPSGRPARA